MQARSCFPANACHTLTHYLYKINPLKTKRILSKIKTRGVPRSKHSPPQFKKQII
jgi:hypothetical protein